MLNNADAYEQSHYVVLARAFGDDARQDDRLHRLLRWLKTPSIDRR